MFGCMELPEAGARGAWSQDAGTGQASSGVSCGVERGAPGAPETRPHLEARGWGLYALSCVIGCGCHGVRGASPHVHGCAQIPPGQRHGVGT